MLRRLGSNCFITCPVIPYSGGAFYIHCKNVYAYPQSIRTVLKMAYLKTQG